MMINVYFSDFKNRFTVVLFWFFKLKSRGNELGEIGF
jgi:hypothetical protein